MTKAEVLLWNCIRRNQIHDIKFRRQFSIEFYVLDFYAPAIKLAIEVDGATHFKDDEIEYDRSRQSDLESKGIEFLRFTNNEVYDSPDQVIELINNKVIELLKKTPS